jgi:hypothetical protein
MENFNTKSEISVKKNDENDDEEEEIEKGISINNLSLSTYSFPDRGKSSKENSDNKNELLALKVSSVQKMSNKPLSSFHVINDFDKSIIQPTSVNDIINIENFEETVTNSDGSTIKLHKSEKELVGTCPQLGTDKAFGRQTRQTIEKVTDDYRYLKDDETESVTDQHGNRITKTAKSANVKYSAGNRITASSIFEKKESQNILPSPSFFERSNIKHKQDQTNQGELEKSSLIAEDFNKKTFRGVIDLGHENKLHSDTTKIKKSCDDFKNLDLNLATSQNLNKNMDSSLIDNSKASNKKIIISHNEDLKESFLNGTNSKVYRSVKGVVGVCPELGSEEAFGQQTRETREKITDKLYSLMDDKTETIEDNFGNKITRTVKSSNIKFSNNNLPFFEDSNTANFNTKGLIQNQNTFTSVPDKERMKSSEFRQENQLSLSSIGFDIEKKYESVKDIFLSSISNENKFKFNVNEIITAKEPSESLNQRNYIDEEKDISQIKPFLNSPDSSVFQQTDVKSINFSRKTDKQKSFLNQHVPTFYPYPSLQTNQPNFYNFTSNLLTTTSFYPINSDVNKSFPLSSQKKYLHDEKYGVMSQIRSTPTIKEIVPPTFSIEIENTTVEKGKTAYFKGTVNGSFPFETIWYIDNFELKTNDHIETSIRQDKRETFLTGLIDYIISLKIKNCSISDIGKYTAYVKNEAGDASCSAFLIIEGKHAFIWNLLKIS